jgi:hypothetical protein
MPNLDFIARMFSKKAGLAALCAWLVCALAREALASPALLPGWGAALVTAASIAALVFIAWKYLCVEAALDEKKTQKSLDV